MAINRSANSGEIYRGIEAGGVNLGGMTPAEARTAFEDHARSAPQKVTLDGPGKQDLTIENVGARFDASVTVERAYAVGREGNFAERASERLRAAAREVQVSPEVEYQPEKVRAGIEKIAGQIDEPSRDASASLSGTDVRITSASEGYDLDVPATMSNVEKALENASGQAKIAGEVREPEVSTQEAEQAAQKARNALSGPTTLKAGTREFTIFPDGLATVISFAREDGAIQVGLDPDSLRDGLDRILSDLESEPTDADLKVNGSGFSVVPAREGKSVDKEKLIGEMEGGLFDGDHTYNLAVTTTKPEITAAEAERLKPTELLGDYRTDYEIVPGNTKTRNQNLRTASSAVSNTMLAPGEVFSMNDTVSTLDYESAKVIVDGKEVETDGGGLCQVTSTLYNAANFAGMDIIERWPHYSQLPYIRPGMDATVWFGQGGDQELDMKFRNTTDGYLLLREYVSNDGYIYAEVYGRPNGTEVSMSSEPIYMNDQQSKWVTYKTVTKNGEVLFDGEFHKDEYGALTDHKGKPIPPPKVNVAPVDP